MRPWMIILASLAGGIVVAAGLVWPELTIPPRPDLATSLLARLPVPLVAFFAVYALATLLLTTGTLVGGLLRLRRRVAQLIVYRGADHADLAAALQAGGLRSLTPAGSGRDGAGPPDHFIDPGRLRREVARLDYIGLARTHFFSALIGLTALVALGLAQDHARFSLLPQAIPTVSTVLIVVGLILLAALARLAIDVAAEPLAETMSRFSVERPDAGLLHRAVELLEAARLTATTRVESTPLPLPERLVQVIEDGHHALVEAIGRMSAAADALAATTRSSVEALEAGLRVNQALPQPEAAAVHGDAAGLAELQGAVEALTALLERLSALPRAEHAVDRDERLDPLPTAPAAVQPHLARELRRLLQEIDAEP